MRDRHGGVAAHERARRNRPGDHASGADDGALPDRDVGQDDHAGANVGVVLDPDGLLVPALGCAVESRRCAMMMTRMPMLTLLPSDTSCG